MRLRVRDILNTYDGTVELPQPQEWRFALERLVARRAISEHTLVALRAAEVGSFLNHNLHQLVLELAAEIPYRDGESIRVPADWWQAFKARWFPLWALRRWPPRREQYVARAYAPEMPRAFGNVVVWRELV